MPKMAIEVPEELTEVGKAMAEHLAALAADGVPPRWWISGGLFGN